MIETPPLPGTHRCAHTGSRRRAWAVIYAGLGAFLAAPQNTLTHLALQVGLVRVRSRRIMAAAFLLIAAFLALAVLLDRWRAAVKATDEYEGVCWACGQTTEHHWGCPNR
jgi:hypothetical protein